MMRKKEKQLKRSWKNTTTLGGVVVLACVCLTVLAYRAHHTWTTRELKPRNPGMLTKIKVSDINEATITFVYCDKNINEKLTNEEVKILKNIVNGKRLSPFKDCSCGFSPYISFRLEDMVFSMATDTCGIIKFERQHKSNREQPLPMLIFISEEEKQKIYDIFGKHGGYFPCV